MEMKRLLGETEQWLVSLTFDTIKKQLLIFFYNVIMVIL